MARTNLIHSRQKCSHSRLAEAVFTACYLWSRIITKSTTKELMAKEVLRGQTPENSWLHVFNLKHMGMCHPIIGMESSGTSRKGHLRGVQDGELLPCTVEGSTKSCRLPRCDNL